MSHRSFIPVTIAAVVATLAAGALHAEPIADFEPVTDAMLSSPDDADWLMWRRTLDGWGYSPLQQITPENVHTLRMVWSRTLNAGSQTGTPIAYNGVLFMPNPNDVIQALDAATGDLHWEHRRPVPEDAAEFLGGLLSSNNRNIAIYANLIIDTSVDDHVFALDAATGQPVWSTQVLDYRTHPAIQGAGPIIANGKVISGRSCSPVGGPDACVITAHDARTGAELWRRRTIPAPGEPGDETWGGVPFEERKHVGTWMPPELRPRAEPDLHRHLGHGTRAEVHAGRRRQRPPVPQLDARARRRHRRDRVVLPASERPLGSGSSVRTYARRHGRSAQPDAVSWINPQLEPGEVRKVMTGIPGKTGVVYTLDRETGEFLWATPTVFQNVISSIEGSTGSVTENPEVVFSELGEDTLICPNMHGGKDWEAGAYSPMTNTMYFPLRNMCMPTLTTTAPDASHTIYALSVRHELAPGKDQLGTVYAISAETGETTWLHEQRASTTSLVATGGGLVFGGDTNGRFKALDQKTGKVLWEINIGSPVTGYPITFAVDGRQYVAVSTGTSATTTSFLRTTPELRPSFGNNLFVFALPDRMPERR